MHGWGEPFLPLPGCWCVYNVRTEPFRVEGILAQMALGGRRILPLCSLERTSHS